MTGRIRTRISDALVYLLLSVLAVLWVLPILFLVYTALRETPSTGKIGRAHV